MKCKSLHVLIGAVFAFGISLSGTTDAVAGPVGTTYTVAGTNFPNTYAATKLTIDGNAELVGGASGMLVNEVITNFAGIAGGINTTNGLPANPNNGNVAGTPSNLSAFSKAGILAEWVFRSNSGGPYNSKAGAWSVDVQGVDMGSGSPVDRPKQTQFVYFLDANGNALPFSAPGIAFLSANGLGVGPHPTNGAIPAVIYTNSTKDPSSVDSFPTGIVNFTIADSGNLNANLVGFLLGFDSPPAGFAIGALHSVPEPSTVVLSIFGAAALMFVGWRKRAEQSR